MLVAFYPLALPGGRREGSDRETLLSRVLPRIAARVLGGSGGIECRFFPVVGRRGDRAGFVTFADAPDPGLLGTLGGPLASPELAVDGMVSRRAIGVRIVHAGGGFPVHESEVPLDWEDPAPALAAWIRQAAVGLDLEPAVPDWATLPRDPLLAWLRAEDDLLALEANVEVDEPLVAVAGLARHIPALPWFRGAWTALFALCGSLVRSGHQGAADALRMLADLAGLVPDDPGLLEQAASLLEEGGLGPHARDPWRRLWAHRPGDRDLAARLSASLADDGCLDEALAVVEAGLGRSPGDAILLAQGALVAARLADQRSCDRFLDTLAHVVAPPLPAARVLGALLVDRGEVERGRTVLAAALEQHPNDAALRLHLGRALAMLGRAADAAGVLEAVLGGADPDLALEAGKYLQLARHPGAIADLEAAERALSSGDARSALGIARRVLRAVPRSADAWQVLGAARSRLGHRRRGASALRRAIGIAPALHEARSELGIALIGLGRFSEAYEHLKVAVAAAPGRAGPMVHMAQACYYLKRFEEGEEWLRRAEAIAPTHSTIQSVRNDFYPNSRG